MRRREFIKVIVASTAAWPFSVRSQQPLPVIGFLSSRSPEDAAHLVRAVRSGLLETGYIEGQNVRIEYRWVRGQYDQLPAMVAELTKIPVAVIAADMLKNVIDVAIGGKADMTLCSAHVCF